MNNMQKVPGSRPVGRGEGGGLLPPTLLPDGSLPGVEYWWIESVPSPEPGHSSARKVWEVASDLELTSDMYNPLLDTHAFTPRTPSTLAKVDWRRELSQAHGG